MGIRREYMGAAYQTGAFSLTLLWDGYIVMGTLS